MKFQHSGTRIHGYALPLAAVRTPGNPGCGEFPDLVRMAELAQGWGFGIIQILPVNDTGRQTSPYSARSAFALHPIHLRIGDLPELSEGAPAPGKPGIADREDILERIEALRFRFGQEGQVRFEEILDEKLDILRQIWEGGARESSAPAVGAWVESRPWARPYACFSEFKRRNADRAWWEWDSCRDPRPADIERLWNDPAFGDDARFWAWLQLRCGEQAGAAADAVAAMGVDLMGDIPILMNLDSADVWYDRKLFRLDLSAGAPPDMYSRMGQNWGFPLYDWEAIAADGYRFWKERLAVADRFYSAYRIDHVLGFFRIWSISAHERDGFLGRFVPEIPLAYPDLAALGFSPERIRWLSRPHVPQWKIDAALAEAGLGHTAPGSGAVWAGASLVESLFARIDSQPLFLFADAIRGTSDIAAAVRAWADRERAEGRLHDNTGRLADRICEWWRDRCLYEYESGRFTASWEYTATTAWSALDQQERGALESLLSLRRGESQSMWERAGRRILGEITGSARMQACAEDLGAVPPCVPRVLEELGIPGLRVLRWHRDWNAEGSPYVALADYPADSVACTSVHDSTCLRQYWAEEADRESLWKQVVLAAGSSTAPSAPAPAAGAVPALPGAELDPASAALLLEAFSTCRSCMVIPPLQDILAASDGLRERDPADERVNVPGTTNPGNWRYRMKHDISTVLADSALAAFARRLAGRRESL